MFRTGSRQVPFLEFFSEVIQIELSSEVFSVEFLTEDGT
ncbi:hypothetical protein LEP1GSC071_0978 [Leptospira santarosai str. JET]|nr:hypothetical protein LEP1GSC071_0978 [Leptospira santarosai str. JET]